MSIERVDPAQDGHHHCDLHQGSYYLLLPKRVIRVEWLCGASLLVGPQHIALQQCSQHTVMNIGPDGVLLRNIDHRSTS